MLRPLLAATALTLVAAAPPSPPAFRMNQLGFEPDGPKIAILVDPAAAPVGWQLLDASGKPVARGTTRVTGDDPASGDQLHRVDLSAVHATGEGFRLAADGVTSAPFTIRPGLFHPLARAAAGFFYQQRSGTPIEARFVERPDLARAAGHAPDRATCFAGTDERGTKWPGCPGVTLDVSRGWYDAGDQGKYVVNGGISAWTLINAWERAHRSGRPAFPDGSLALPEQGNGVPDILDEARWEVDFLLAMQVPDGTHLTLATELAPDGRVAKWEDADASGLVFQKVADEHWTGIPTAPADDRETRFLYPPTTGATLNMAAVAAQAARAWKGIDDAFAARCLQASERGFAAALRHPRLLATSSFTGSGGYGDADLSDEFFWAAAELYATTGKPDYLRILHASPYWQANDGHATAIGWASTAMLGTITLAIAPSPLAAADQAMFRDRIVAAARQDRAHLDQGYGVPADMMRLVWGSNGDILDRAVVLGTAYDLTGDRADRDAVVASVDYMLGRNPLDLSFVTGFGARAMTHPHHRFWAHQANASYPLPPSGVLSGGPNASEANGRVHPELKGCAPERCWIDDYRAFTVNEVAINWNAPLVWAAAFLDTTEPR